MKNFKIYWGETLPMTVEDNNPLALSATITVDTNPRIVKQAEFVDGFADISLSADETEVLPGTYDYELKIIYDDGRISKFPDVSDCTSCKMPTITIRESLDMPGVS